MSTIPSARHLHGRPFSNVVPETFGADHLSRKFKRGQSFQQLDPPYSSQSRQLNFKVLWIWQFARHEAKLLA
jgi:hypothetical protein